MQPVVDGLEELYGEQIEFQQLDANSRDGQQAFRSYRLQGHPSYVIINPAGEVLWTGLGEQSGEALANQVLTVLN